MKKYIIIGLMLLLSVSFWNCEKDDLCAEDTPTTPQVVINFFDALNADNAKNITNLKYYEVDELGIQIGNTLVDNAVSTIKIPLRTSQNSSKVRFKLILNGNDDDGANDIEDFILFNYTTNDIYISRACGFKTTFELNNN